MASLESKNTKLKTNQKPQYQGKQMKPIPKQTAKLPNSNNKP